MSIHSSLKQSSTMKRHRSVLTRLERIRILHERGRLNAEGSSLFGLPKVKHLKIRIRKEKAAAPATEGTVAATLSAAAPSAAGAAAKPAAKAPAGQSKTEAAPSPKKKE